MVGRRRGPVCDQDCFHCIYPDCILDKVPAADAAKEDLVIDAVIAGVSAEVKEQAKAKGKKRNAKYYREHRDKILQRNTAYYYAHYDRIRAYKRRYRIQKIEKLKEETE